MRSIGYGEIVEGVAGVCVGCCYELPGDVLGAIETAAKSDSDARARRVLEQLIENARIAREERVPLCQDTGLAVVFVEVGSEVVVEGGGGKTLDDAINEGVCKGYDAFE